MDKQLKEIRRAIEKHYRVYYPTTTKSRIDILYLDIKKRLNGIYKHSGYPEATETKKED